MCMCVCGGGGGNLHTLTTAFTTSNRGAVWADAGSQDSVDGGKCWVTGLGCHLTNS